MADSSIREFELGAPQFSTRRGLLVVTPLVLVASSMICFDLSRMLQGCLLVGAFVLLGVIDSRREFWVRVTADSEYLSVYHEGCLSEPEIVLRSEVSGVAIGKIGIFPFMRIELRGGRRLVIDPIVGFVPKRRRKIMAEMRELCVMLGGKEEVSL